MNYATYKHEFIRQLALSGENSPDAVSESMLQALPPNLRERWTNRFYASPRPVSVPAQPRLLNHFKVGADPEFMFHVGGEPSFAENFNLMAGLCVGADNNGRLVELRPKPSRFALEVLASMLSELRWLGFMRPKTLEFEWKAGAFLAKDGLGGHVHFGRKQTKARSDEIDALASVTAILESSEVFSKREMKLRRSDAQGGHYGSLTDFRIQAHGWEYRALPSWLNTPWLAYLSLVLSKLAVCDPKFFQQIPAVTSAAAARKWLRNTLARYKDLDDDARIAYLGLDVWGLPRSAAFTGDFKGAWGLPMEPFADETPWAKPVYLPPMIAPSAKDTEDVFKLLVSGKRLATALPSPPTWGFQRLPAQFAALQLVTNTKVSPGLGELVWDGVYFADTAIRVLLASGDAGKRVYVAPSIQGGVPALRAMFPEVIFHVGHVSASAALSFAKGLMGRSTLPLARRILYSGLLPVARYDELDKLFAWREKYTKVPKQSAGVSKLLVHI